MKTYERSMSIEKKFRWLKCWRRQWSYVRAIARWLNIICPRHHCVQFVRFSYLPKDRALANAHPLLCERLQNDKRPGPETCTQIPWQFPKGSLPCWQSGVSYWKVPPRWQRATAMISSNIVQLSLRLIVLCHSLTGKIFQTWEIRLVRCFIWSRFRGCMDIFPFGTVDSRKRTMRSVGSSMETLSFGSNEIFVLRS